MTLIELDQKRTLRNWIADGVITADQASDIIEIGHIKDSKRLLLSYDDLGNYGVLANSMRFDAGWNSGYQGLF
jgi:hypothetical protein